MRQVRNLVAQHAAAAVRGMLVKLSARNHCRSFGPQPVSVRLVYGTPTALDSNYQRAQGNPTGAEKE